MQFSSKFKGELKALGLRPNETDTIYRIQKDGKNYGVDFRTEEIFWFDGANRINDPADEFLQTLNKLAERTSAPAATDDTRQSESEDESTTAEAVQAEIVSDLPALRDADIVRPAVNAQAALQAWQEFQALKTNILAKSDLQRIQGKDFIKKSGWRKFATFYNLTDRIVEETRINCPDGSFIWKVKAECIAPNGRRTEGVAMCSSAEKSGARIEHDTYSTAHTRAKNRAISDMIAAGEVSAEEVA
jgi:hypothetical protein